LGGAVSFLPKAWLNAWGALLLAAAVAAAPAWCGQVPVAMRPWACGGWVFAAALIGLVVQGALYRLGTSPSVADARRRGLGIGGIQFGMPELRLLAAGAMAGLFLAVIAGGLALVFVFVLAALGLSFPNACALIRSALNGDGEAVLLAVMAAAFAWVLVQLAVRLSLFKAATVGRGRIASLDSMSLVQGAFWRLLAGLIAVFLPAAAFVAWRMGLFGHALTMTLDSKAWALIHAGFLTLVQLPLAIGFLSYAYNRLEYR
jgi:hypothetical protein